MMASVDWKPVYARRAECMKGAEIPELLRLLEQPGHHFLCGRQPRPSALPGPSGSNRLSGKGVPATEVV